MFGQSNGPGKKRGDDNLQGRIEIKREIGYSKAMYAALVERKRRSGVDVAEQVRRAIARDLVQLPLLGSVPCGELHHALNEPVECVTLAELLEVPDYDIDSFFVLKAVGESMSGAGIFNGDTVILQAGKRATTGDICACCVNDEEVTLKVIEFIDEGRRLRLRSAHPDFDDIEVPTQTVTIAGVFHRVIGKRTGRELRARIDASKPTPKRNNKAA